MWVPKTPGDAAKAILFCAGLAGAAHQELTGISQPALLPLYALMLGLPAFTGLDKWWRQNPPDPPDEHGGAP